MRTPTITSEPLMLRLLYSPTGKLHADGFRGSLHFGPLMTVCGRVTEGHGWRAAGLRTDEDVECLVCRAKLARFRAQFEVTA